MVVRKGGLAGLVAVGLVALAVDVEWWQIAWTWSVVRRLVDLENRLEPVIALVAAAW